MKLKATGLEATGGHGRPREATGGPLEATRGPLKTAKASSRALILTWNTQNLVP